MRCLALLVLLVACSSHGGSPSSSPDGGNGVTPDAATGGGGGGSGGGGGGSATMSELRFAVVGDTRPPNIDDMSGYPTPIITKIWQDIEAESPAVPFVVSTGDYMFASTSGSLQQPQLNLYMGARAGYHGVQYPAMGNHECTGATASNCGAGAADGITKNMTDWMNTMLHPIGVTQPYYTETFSAPDNSWNAKFVFVACNAWNQTQSAWLSNALAVPTTYTFVVRHEGDSSLSQTPCSASQSIIAAHPVTLKIVGHTHTYAHYSSSKEIIVGNGGAPLTSGNNYGYVLVTRQANGNLLVQEKDYQTGAVLDTFQISASGAGA